MRNLLETGLTLALLLAASGAAQADDQAIAEKLATNHCAVCHTFKQGEPHGQGPNLYGLLGRKAASAPGFTYSDGFRQAMADKTWDDQLLDAWLTDTQTVAPGNAMTYFQDDPAKRARIIQYVQSLH
ncbi:cytochrome C [Pseudomonas sp. DY-1]|jgi:cytochrome c|uniref:c-type cytochrome n=1 Tax=Pseudomonas sp. DY-1 TaxID=1755504 RepID=UPI000EAA22AE|nr:c-type cytochrome [Pseudomonas sp. DY-1]AYF85995.1 cytochrome C [Pseudomonas sp. DY-1]